MIYCEILWDSVRYCDVQLCDCKYSYSGCISAVVTFVQFKMYLVRLQCVVIVGSF